MEIEKLSEMSKHISEVFAKVYREAWESQYCPQYSCNSAESDMVGIGVIGFIPIPHQGAIFVGSSSAPQRTVLHASSPQSSPP